MAIILCLLLSSLHAAGSRNFDGVNDVIDINQKPPTGTGDFSLCIWAYIESLTSPSLGKGMMRSISSPEAAGDWILGHGVLNGSNVVFFNWRSSGADFDGRATTTTDPLSTDTWFHICATWDGSTNRIYVDGVEQALSLGTTSNGWGDDEYIGASFQTSTFQFDGNLADARVYAKTLSESEVNIAMRCLNQPQDSLVAHWLLMDDGSNFEDLSVDDNDAICTGSECPALSQNAPPSGWCRN